MPTPTKPTIAESLPTTEERLEEIVLHLRHIDRRDSLRMWGSFFRSLITIIPVLLLLWSAWYTYLHWPEILKEISKSSAEQMLNLTKDDSLKQLFGN